MRSRLVTTLLACAAVVGAGMGGAAGSVVGARVTAKPKTRGVTQREGVYVDGRPGERRGHHKHGRDD
jgi:hypothetical protein